MISAPEAMTPRTFDEWSVFEKRIYITHGTVPPDGINPKPGALPPPDDVAGIVEKLDVLCCTRLRLYRNESDKYLVAMNEARVIIESLAAQVADFKEKWRKSERFLQLAWARAESHEAQLAAKDEEIKALRGHADRMADEWQGLYPNDTPPVSRTSYRAAYPKEPT